MSQSGTDPFDQVWMLVQINCVLRTDLEQIPVQDKRIRTSRRKSPEKAVDFRDSEYFTAICWALDILLCGSFPTDDSRATF